MSETRRQIEFSTPSRSTTTPNVVSNPSHQTPTSSTSHTTTSHTTTPTNYKNKYTFVVLPSYMQPNARTWEKIVEPYQSGFLMFLRCIELYQKNLHDNGPSSSTGSNNNNISDSSPMESHGRNGVGQDDEIGIYPFMSTKDGSRAYLWNIRFRNTRNASLFYRAFQDCCTQMNQSIQQEREKLQKNGHNSFVKQPPKKRSYDDQEVQQQHNQIAEILASTNGIPTQIATIISFFIRYLQDAEKAVTGTSNDIRADPHSIIKSFTANWTVDELNKIFDAKISDALLKDFVPEKDGETGRAIPPTLLEKNFQASGYRIHVLPHISPIETFVINRLQEVEWRKPSDVSAITNLVTTPELTQNRTVSYDKVKDRAILDWLHYIRAFNKERISKMNEQYNSSESHKQWLTSYVSIVNGNKNFASKLIEILFNPNRPDELSRKYEGSTNAVLDYIKKLYIPQTGQYTLFGWPSSKRRDAISTKSERRIYKTLGELQEIEKQTFGQAFTTREMYHSMMNEDGMSGEEEEDGDGDGDTIEEDGDTVNEPPPVRHLPNTHWKPGEELIAYFEFLTFSYYAFQRGLKESLVHYILMRFYSYSQFHSDKHQLPHILYDGVASSGKSTTQGAVIEGSIPGTFETGATEPSKRALFANNIQSGKTVVYDENPQFLNPTVRSEEVESLRRDFKQGATDQYFSRNILEPGKRRTLNGDEINTRDTTTLNVFNNNPLLIATNISIYSLPPPLRQRFIEMHAEPISTERFANNTQSAKQQKYLIQEAAEYYQHLSRGIQAGMFFTYKAKFIGFSRQTDSIYVDSVVNTLMNYLKSCGFSIPEFRKIGFLNRLVELLSYAFSWFKSCVLSKDSTQQYPTDCTTGSLWGKPFEASKFVEETMMEQAVTLAHISASFSLFFDVLVDQRILFLRRGVFDGILGFFAKIRHMHENMFRTPLLKPDEIVPNFNYHLFALQHKIMSAPSFDDKVSFHRVDGKIRFRNQSSSRNGNNNNNNRGGGGVGVGGGGGGGNSTGSTNPTDQVTEEDNVWVDPNRISFVTKSLDHHAQEVLSKHPTGSIYNKRSIVDMIHESQNVMIVPKCPLQYVREKELREKTKDLFSSGFKSAQMFDQHGNRLKDLRTGAFLFPRSAEWDTFFKPLKEGQAYHPDLRTNIYRSTDKVPAVIIESYGTNGEVCISYHMDLVRMNPEADLKNALLSLSRFCTKDTKVPVITKSGFSILTIPKTKQPRVSIPLAQQDISGDKEESKELRKNTNKYIQQVFETNVKSGIMGFEGFQDRLNINRDIMLLKTRIALATRNQERELVLPAGVSADDFFRQYHFEELGIKQERHPSWIENYQWTPETLMEKLYRQQMQQDWELFDESIEKGKNAKLICDYIQHLHRTHDHKKLIDSFFGLYPDLRCSTLHALHCKQDWNTFNYLFKNGVDDELYLSYQKFLRDAQTKYPLRQEEIQSQLEHLENTYSVTEEEEQQQPRKEVIVVRTTTGEPSTPTQIPHGRNVNVVVATLPQIEGNQ